MSASDSILFNEFEDYTFNFAATFAKDQWAIQGIKNNMAKYSQYL